MKFSWSRALIFLWILVVVPVTAHVLFSSLGFNPTDDGFTLAYTRRLLDGQIPHRDFIIIRPAGSPLLHSPVVLFGGQFMYWISRLIVWLQFAVIAWLWTTMIVHLSALTVPRAVFAGLVTVSFMLSAHTFPIMAWHTIDGLMFVSLGFVLRIFASRRWHFLAYVLVGTSYVCKQSFLLTPLLTLLAFSDWRRMRYWVAIAMPGMLYICYLLVNQALEAGWQQLNSQTGILHAGLISYLTPETLIGILVGYLCVRLTHIHPDRLRRRILLLVTVVIMAGAVTSTIGYYPAAFYLFGMTLGFMIHAWLERSQPSAFVRPLQLLLITAWSVSLSVGYNSPILMSGPMVVLWLTFIYERSQPRWNGWANNLAAAITVICLTVVFVIARTQFIYREQASTYLNAELDAVLPGGAWIRTNPYTYAWLSDLHKAVKWASDQHLTYAIVPDVPGWWAKSSQPNPLPIDWIQTTELNQPALTARVIDSLESLRAEGVIILQNVNAHYLAQGFLPLETSDQHEIVDYIKDNLTPIAQTEYFTLYR